MKLLLAGYYGSRNLGDEALLQVILDEIKESIPGAKVTVLSAKPEWTTEEYRVDAIAKFSFPQALKAMKSSDAVIFGGGGLLQDATSKKSLLYYVNLIRFAKFYKKKIILLAQGIGPLKDKKHVKKALEHVDLVSVRDEASLKGLVNIGARPKRLALTSDLAFLLKPAPLERVNKLLFDEGIKLDDKKLVAVSLRKPVDINDNGSFKVIAGLCDHLIRTRDVNVVFIPFAPEDQMVIKKVMSSMDESSVMLSRQYTPDEMLGIISKFSALIGMRLHSLIMAAGVNVPCFGISYDPKVTAFQASIQMPCVNISNIDEQKLKQDVAVFLADSKINTGLIDEIKKRAKSNITMMLEVLNKNRIDVLDVDVDNFTLDESVKKAEALLLKRNHSLIVTPNPEMIMAAQKDMELKNIIDGAGLALPDGVGLKIAGKILGKPFKQRVTGVDLMMKIIELSKSKGYKIFLFGGAEGVAGKAALRIGSNVVGYCQGYTMSDPFVVDKILQARPDILFIGLGSPKQEKWASKHLRQLNVPLTMCVGGSLDVLSGRVKRAPQFMQNIGLEWLWRLVNEPRRIKRMLILPVFLYKVILSRFGLR
jgi:polysaccharide pyruvyl transferase CsaB